MASSMWKTTIREIKHSLGRYLAILAIIALGVGFFVGLKITRPVMHSTVNEYVKEYNLFDYQLLSTVGFKEEDVEKIGAFPDVKVAVGAYSVDVLYEQGEAEDALKLYTITEGVNECKLVAGTMPSKNNECVLDANLAEVFPLGSEIVFSANNKEDTLEMLKYTKYQVVGHVYNPVYLNAERGTTTLGDGQLSGFAYLMSEGFDSEYYTEILLKYNHSYEMYSDEYETFIEAREDALEALVEERVDIRYACIMDEANAKLADGEKELKDAEIELADGEKKLQDGEKELLEGERDIAKAKQDLAKGERELNKQKEKAEKDFAEAKKQIEDGEKAIKENGKTIADGEKKIKEAETTITTNETALKTQQTELLAQKEQIEAGLAEIKAQREALGEQAIYYEETFAAKEAELNQALAMVKEGLAQITAGLQTIESSKAEIAKQKKELEKGRKELEKAKKEIKKARKEYQDGLATYEEEITKAEKELADGKKKIKDGEQDIEEGKLEIEDAKAEIADGKIQLADAKKEITDAKEKLADISDPQHYVLGRDTNMSYVTFDSDSMIVDNIAAVFPLFFFLVALLVCVTTMNRMVDDQRTQIGVLKALGYSKLSILGNYVFYSGSSGLLGGLLGFAIGSTVFPYIIWTAYGMMYDVEGTRFVFSVGWLIFSIIMSLLCSVGATVITCYVEFASVPAMLIRPKAPKTGKRIFLEYVKPFWNRMSFLQKVSIRNVFRYKRRFLMMILGISGCTALMIAGFGIKDSISNIGEYQYDDIFQYDLEILLKEPAIADDMDGLSKEFEDTIEDMLYTTRESVDLIRGDSKRQATLIVPQVSQELTDYIVLRREDGTVIAEPPKGEVVITDKLASRLSVVVGDSITVRNGDMQEMTVVVADIAKNYVGNYIYMAEQTYMVGYSKEPEYKGILAKSKQYDGVKTDAHKIAARFADNELVMQVSVNQDSKNRLGDMLNNLTAVVLLVIVCAGALAFVVLYTLTNINIMERIREIATIKVLGFYDGETAQYVFRENMLMTVFGALLGLVLGKLLHAFVIFNVDVEMVTFSTVINPMSFVYSFVLTVVFSLFVDMVFYFKLNKINMAESLKSIE